MRFLLWIIVVNCASEWYQFYTGSVMCVNSCERISVDVLLEHGNYRVTLAKCTFENKNETTIPTI